MYLTAIKCRNSLLADGLDFLSPEVFRSMYCFMVFVIEKAELEYHSGFSWLNSLSFFLLPIFMLLFSV